jgi:uncharacterized protein Smg (DUF494 family)
VTESLRGEQREINLHERIINLVSLIADQVQTKQELFSNEGKIMDSLMNRGYRLHEADAALTLMQTLAQNEGNAFSSKGNTSLPAGMRAMNTEERGRFAMEAFGFITKLAHLGIITCDQREDLLEKALTLHSRKIELSHVKTLIALNLFADAQEDEDLLLSSLNVEGTAWN